MAFPTYPNSAACGDLIDANLFMNNFDELIFGTIDGKKDINVMSSNFQESVLVNNDFDSSDVNVSTSFEAQTTDVNGNFYTAYGYLNNVFSVSGESMVCVNVTDVVSNVLSADFQTLSKLHFNLTLTTDIVKISTENFVNGDILVLNCHVNGGGGIITIKNSHPSGNIFCGTDITFVSNDTLVFLYNGDDAGFDLLHKDLL